MLFVALLETIWAAKPEFAVTGAVCQHYHPLSTFVLFSTEEDRTQDLAFSRQARSH